MTATEEPLEPEQLEPEEEAPQGPVSVSYGNRRYVSDRSFLPKLQQWFIPLPNKPKLAPLDREALRQKAADVHLDAADDLLEEATAVWEARLERITSAESKATTLLGTVAIAASLVVAGSGLILDPAKVASAYRVRSK